MPAESTLVINLTVHAGEDRGFVFQVYQADGVSPQNIVGASFTFSLFPYGQPLNPYFTKTVGNGITLSNPGLGQLIVNFASADTVSIPAPDCLEYYLERTDSGADGLPTRGLLSLLPK